VGKENNKGMSRKHRPAAYGTKAYARRVVLQALREWARRRRALFSLSPTAEMAERYIAQTYDNEAFGALIGATRALRATGAMSERLESYYDRRFERINHAEVRRTRANALREAA
jgi:hypothetical protein